MAAFYGFVAPAELSSGHDPLRVLRVALARADLVATLSYDPDSVSFWAKSAISSSEAEVFEIENQSTGLKEPACVCALQTA